MYTSENRCALQKTTAFKGSRFEKYLSEAYVRFPRKNGEMGSVENMKLKKPRILEEKGFRSNRYVNNNIAFSLRHSSRTN